MRRITSASSLLHLDAPRPHLTAKSHRGSQRPHLVPLHLSSHLHNMPNLPNVKSYYIQDIFGYGFIALACGCILYALFVVLFENENEIKK